ncbi:hypothetical protein [Synechococcus sp. MIT S9508]|uniref:hypothetical protein n=1 Tax=Synechococcus sp. MIT S9508 TaxID=1801629 RepID=UPI0007BBA545|nr:hypothetical protein [Synechococcus sp. MIT S9508]KZR90562.1 hypothetical protein MITS9508_00563 [Synechococcus sp. MIT S9508]
MTTSTRAVSTSNHFLDALRGFAALFATDRSHQSLLNIMGSNFQGLNDVVQIEKGI